MKTKLTERDQMGIIGMALADLRTLDPFTDGSFYDVVPQLFMQDGGWTWVRQWPSGGYSVVFHGTLPQIRAKIEEQISAAKTRKYRETCRMSLEWIENLIKKYGEEAIFDALPNDTGGRVWLQEAINLK